MYKKLVTTGVVAILRGTKHQDALQCVDAFCRAGIVGIEVTFNTPGAPAIIEDIASRHPDICVGAGTVLTVDDVVRAHNAGAKFILAPDTNPEVISATKTRGMLSVPGAYTATEVLAAVRAGADIVKIFPAGAAGAAYIKDLLGPLNGFRFMAVGGVSLENTASFFKAGAVSVGVGGQLVNGSMIATANWKGLEELASRFLEEARKGREGQ